MKESEALWNEDELLAQMEQMQDQIDQLGREKARLIRELAEKDTRMEELEQTNSSEISKLQSALQQAQRKLQEQSAQIVKQSGADLILHDNEKLKEENRRLINEKEQSAREAVRMEEACNRRLQKKDEKVLMKCRELEEARARVRQKEVKADELIRDRERLIFERVDTREKKIREESARDYNHLLKIARDGWTADKKTMLRRLTITGLYSMFLSGVLSVRSGANVFILQALAKIAGSLRAGGIWLFGLAYRAATLSNIIPVPLLSTIIHWGILIIIIGGCCAGIMILLFSSCRWFVQRLKGRMLLWHILMILSGGNILFMLFEGSLVC